MHKQTKDILKAYRQQCVSGWFRPFFYSKHETKLEKEQYSQKAQPASQSRQPRSGRRFV